MLSAGDPTMLALLPLMVAAMAPPPSAAPPTVVVTLSSFAYAPSPIRLRAGQTVTLRLTNTSGGGHDFSAPEFFTASRIVAGAPAIRRGKVDVPGGASVSMTLVPKAGAYPLKCTHFGHKLMGMSGTIVVE
jgi:plastocyanin